MCSVISLARGPLVEGLVVLVGDGGVKSNCVSTSHWLHAISRTLIPSGLGMLCDTSGTVGVCIPNHCGSLAEMKPDWSSETLVSASMVSTCLRWTAY